MSNVILKFGQSVKYLKELEEQREAADKGQKRKRFNDFKIRNQRKLLRNSGQEYVNVSNEFVDGEKFQFCTKCCFKECHLKFKKQYQESLFEHFWGLSNYNKQNFYLFGLMDRKVQIKVSVN